MATVTYTFWSGQPYVIMESKLEVLEDVRFRDCRNDEFVIGEQLPDRGWMGADGDMPYAGRETWLGWFTEQIEEQLRARLRHVGQVVVQLVREPKWTPRQMNDRARRTIGSRG